MMCPVCEKDGTLPQLQVKIYACTMGEERFIDGITWESLH